MKAKNATVQEPKKPVLKRILLWATALVAFVFLARHPFLYILKTENGRVFASLYPVQEERWDHPRLQELRRREHLDQVIAPGKTEFEKMVLLRKWTRAQWSGKSSDFYYPPWDALEILDLARQHDNQAFCAQYAIVYLQACLALGWPAVYVDLPGHFVTAVWSNDFDRWVLMDPTGDVHYERDGIPVNGRRLAAAYWSNDVRGITKVGSDGTRTPVHKEDLEIYRMYSIVLRNNHLTQPISVERNGQRMTLVREADYRKYPLIGRDRVGFGDAFLAWKQNGQTEFFPNKIQTDDPDNFRDPVNQTIIEVVSQDVEKGWIKLRLRPENSSTFQTFLVGGIGPKWEAAPSLILFNLAFGMNRVYARIQTKFGWVGKPSSILILYKPDFWEWFLNQLKKPAQD